MTPHEVLIAAAGRHPGHIITIYRGPEVIASLMPADITGGRVDIWLDLLGAPYRAAVTARDGALV